MTPSATHAVLIPTFNTGAKVLETVAQARHYWHPVWVVVDGSDDGTAEQLLVLAAADEGLSVWVLPTNQGKGAAVLFGLAQALKTGFTHVLTMDADGQHPADKIIPFMQASAQDPQAMILGRPQFDANAPLLRVRGRKISNWWANVETWHGGIGDSLFGFRVYPVAPLFDVMRHQRWMKRFDFDPEAVVRLCWRGVRPINRDAPVKYWGAHEGGVSHFHYGRDNLLLTFMHIRLMLGFLLRWPMLLRRRLDQYQR